MPSCHESRRLGYSPEDLFDLVADVERYPEFLPWWEAARVVERKGETYRTDQVISFGPLRRRFSSTTVLERPRCIEVTSERGPYPVIDLQWRFDPVPEEGCRVHLEVDVGLGSRLLDELARVVLSDIAARVVAAFESRARALYGPPADARAGDW